MRVVSGRFERGMKVKNARTGKAIQLSRPSQLFGQAGRMLLEEVSESKHSTDVHSTSRVRVYVQAFI